MKAQRPPPFCVQGWLSLCVVKRDTIFILQKPRGVRASQNQPGCLVDLIYFMIKSCGLTHLLTEMDVVD